MNKELNVSLTTDSDNDLYENDDNDNYDEDEMEIINPNDLYDTKGSNTSDEESIINQNEDNTSICLITPIPIPKPKSKRQLQHINQSRHNTHLNTLFNISPSKKTIFSTITEKAYENYIKSNASKPNIFNNLVSEPYIINQLERQESKKNGNVIINMIQRQSDYEIKHKSSIQKMKEEYNKDRKAKCKSMLYYNSNNDDDNKGLNKNASHGIVKDFLLKQDNYIKQREDSLNKLKHQYDVTEKNKDNFIPRISKQSKKLLGLHQQDKSNGIMDSRNSDVWIRLNCKHHEKDKTMTMAKTNANSKTTGNNSKRKSNGGEEKLLIERLSKSIAKAQALNNKPKSHCLISQSTKKLILNKFVLLFKETVTKLFNKQGNNISLSHNEYKLLLYEIGFIDCNKALESEALIDKAYKKYLHVSNDTVETYWLLLFCLCWLGVYELNDVTDNNKPPTSIIKHLPYIDHQIYHYDSNTIQKIKRVFRPFNIALLTKWGDQSLNKKLTKLNQLYPEFNLNKSLKPNTKTKTRINACNMKPIKLNKATNNNTIQNPIISIYHKKKTSEIIKQYKAQEEDQFKLECTFQPNTNKKQSQNNKESIEQLYLDSKLRLKYKEKGICKRNAKGKDEDLYNNTQKEERGFNKLIKPSLLNPILFDCNPLANDKQLNKTIQRLKEYKEQKNSNCISINNKTLRVFHRSNSASLDQPLMHFDIEIKTNKDNIYH